MTEDGRMDYIKESLDGLHVKVDVLFKDADLRLKSLEESRSEVRGWVKFVSVSGALTAITAYFFSGK